MKHYNKTAISNLRSELSALHSSKGELERLLQFGDTSPELIEKIQKLKAQIQEKQSALLDSEKTSGLSSQEINNMREESNLSSKSAQETQDARDILAASPANREQVLRQKLQGKTFTKDSWYTVSMVSAVTKEPVAVHGGADSAAFTGVVDEVKSGLKQDGDSKAFGVLLENREGVPTPDNHFVSVKVTKKGNGFHVEYLDSNGEVAEPAFIQDLEAALGGGVKLFYRDKELKRREAGTVKEEDLYQCQFDYDSCGAHTAAVVNFYNGAKNEAGLEEALKAHREKDVLSVRAEHGKELEKYGVNVSEELRGIPSASRALQDGPPAVEEQLQAAAGRITSEKSGEKVRSSTVTAIDEKKRQGVNNGPAK